MEKCNNINLIIGKIFYKLKKNVFVYYQIIVFFINFKKNDNIWLKFKEDVGFKILVNCIFGFFEK